ncbi:hypothetical protein MARPO_0108s0059 [Marchantia polymorpha]|uniref:Uncharacterized protein n=1 Tax=Marchantia polymorpha TaxID=3197 RepID=A0A2R6WD00_MARPO|nr:hypothetical protein MARPO_0108s0059 [Marchantia polymorpha]|eukprot:PTQ31714.1 hypothetical protein MARPO_0108s0059 [Marchantia polymorpha]
MKKNNGQDAELLDTALKLQPSKREVSFIQATNRQSTKLPNPENQSKEIILAGENNFDGRLPPIDDRREGSKTLLRYRNDLAARPVPESRGNRSLLPHRRKPEMGAELKGGGSGGWRPREAARGLIRAAHVKHQVLLSASFNGKVQQRESARDGWPCAELTWAEPSPTMANAYTSPLKEKEKKEKATTERGGSLESSCLEISERSEAHESSGSPASRPGTVAIFVWVNGAFDLSMEEVSPLRSENLTALRVLLRLRRGQRRRAYCELSGLPPVGRSENEWIGALNLRTPCRLTSGAMEGARVQASTRDQIMSSCGFGYDVVERQFSTRVPNLMTAKFSD